MSVILVCLGGALGSGSRYLVGIALQKLLGGGMPWGTLAVNILGSLLLATLMQATDESSAKTLRLALGTGFMGGFTTYSTFNLDTLQLLDRGAWGLALAQITMTVAGCLIAGAVGWLWLGRLFKVHTLS